VRVICTWPTELIETTFGRSCKVPVCSLLQTSGTQPDASAVPQSNEQPANSSMVESRAKELALYLRLKLMQLLRLLLFWLPLKLFSFLPNRFHLSSSNWEDALQRDIWAPLAQHQGKRHRGMLLWHYEKQQAMFSEGTWRSVAQLLRDARLVVVSEGSDQPALEALTLLACNSAGTPVIPMACFPREALISPSDPSWLVASLLPMAYSSTFAWHPTLRQLVNAMSHQVAYVLMRILQCCQTQTGRCHMLGNDSSANFLQLANMIMEQAQGWNPRHGWAEIEPKLTYSNFSDNTNLRIQAFSSAVVTSFMSEHTKTEPQVHLFGAILPPPDAFGQPPSDLQAFLHAEGPPIVFFGHVCSPDLQICCLDVIERLQCRAVFGFVIHPQTMYDPRYQDIYCQGRLYTYQARMPPVQHTWLFRHVHAAVHHAGAGTVQAALSCGVPSLAIPHWGDQFFWAHRVYALQAGPAPIMRATLVEHPDRAASLLEEGLRACLTDPRLKEGARRVARLMRYEDGIGEAVSLALEACALSEGSSN